MPDPTYKSSHSGAVVDAAVTAVQSAVSSGGTLLTTVTGYDKTTLDGIIGTLQDSVDSKAASSNVYSKSEVYTKSEVNTRLTSKENVLTAGTNITIDRTNPSSPVISASQLNLIKVVGTLPTTNIDQNTIYFVPRATSQTDYAYDKYMYVTYNGASRWEKINVIAIDLSPYALQSTVNDTYKNIYISYNGDSVSLNKTKVNNSTTNELIKLADSTNAGLMSPADVVALSTVQTDISSLKSQGVRLSYTTSSDPSAQDILNFVVACGYTDPSQYTGVSVVVSATKHIWRWYDAPKIKGQWVLKTAVNPDTLYGQDVVFTSNGTTFKKIESSQTQSKIINYINNQGTALTVYNGNNGGWIAGAYKTIQFGTSYLDVTKYFLEWIIANVDIPTANSYSFGAFQDDGVDVVALFNNVTAGIIKGSSVIGRVYAENDGTGSVYGWDSAINSIGESYNPASVYLVGAKVIHNAQLYECITAVDTAETFDPDKWQAVSASQYLTQIINYQYSADPLNSCRIGNTERRLVPQGTIIDERSLAIGLNSINNSARTTLVGANAYSGTYGEYNTIVGAYASVGDSTSAATAIGDYAANNISSTICFDGLAFNRTVQLYNPSTIFFRKGNVSNEQTTFASYTEGYTLLEKFAGLTNTDNTNTELKYEYDNDFTLTADRVFTFKSAPTNTGSHYTCKPRYFGSITNSGSGSITITFTGISRLKGNTNVTMTIVEGTNSTVTISSGSTIEFDIYNGHGSLTDWSF